MPYRSTLRGYAVAALQGSATLAGQNVFASADWPTVDPDYPAILVQCYREKKESRAKGSQIPQFIATAVLAITGRVKGTGAASGGPAVQALLDQFEDQILYAVTTCQPLISAIQRFAWVDTDQEISAKGQYHAGEVRMNFGLEFPVDIDPYSDRPAALPPLGVPLEQVELTWTVPAGTPQPGLNISLPQE
ncbi:hypothetical protein ACFSHT_15915 [Paraburkholderia silviterrae]|uniref:Uncharacterized protein n=1 Tax=Paraburkholderia silviterrae TaxID=2528715 RepID=A0A4R5MA80_9BURK|nr:hypothetical protein [Paraburkholderia silviterrae]TDG23220.1 hypothetical protein EYW47_14915 [Paraburkholderia silviterrae]